MLPLAAKAARRHRFDLPDNMFSFNVCIADVFLIMRIKNKESEKNDTHFFLTLLAHRGNLCIQHTEVS